MSATHAGPAREHGRDSGDRPRPVENARRQALNREINERTASIDTSAEGALAFVCECAKCSFEPLTLDRDTYETVRRFPTRFVVKPGHVAPDEERIVEEAAAYVVVEKTGPSARLSIRFDPRGSHRRPRGASTTRTDVPAALATPTSGTVERQPG